MVLPYLEMLRMEHAAEHVWSLGPLSGEVSGHHQKALNNIVGPGLSL